MAFKFQHITFQGFDLHRSTLSTCSFAALLKLSTLAVAAHVEIESNV